MKRPIAVSLLLLFANSVFAPADEPPQPITVAVLDFQEGNTSVKGLGSQAATLLNANLSSDPALVLVERAELDKVIGEFELGLTGNVSPASAARIGELTGARILVTGRVFEVASQTFIVSKIISVETGRVYGEKAQFQKPEQLDTAVTTLGKAIGTLIRERGNTLLAQVESPAQRTERLRKLIPAGSALPSVFVSIPEQHLTRTVPDPAAQTEIQLTLQQLGFPLAQSTAESGVQILGEAFSERAAQRGQLIACRARVEVKVLGEKGKLLAVERQSAGAVDLSENVAAKLALQKAGLLLSERLVSPLVSRAAP